MCSPGNKATFSFPWSEGRWQTRIVDDWDNVTGTIQEATLLKWSELNLEDVHSDHFLRFNEKLKQAAQDAWLLRNAPEINNAIWYGQEPLPTFGRVSQLTNLLNDAGIQYRVVRPR